MTGRLRDDDDSLTADSVRAIDRVCDRFERAWRDGGKPRLENYLGEAAGTVRSVLLRELLLLELELRQDVGDTPAPGEYYTRFPNESDVVTGALDESLRQGTDDPGVAASSGPTDRYQLLGELGHGGIGVVFRGYDRHLGRHLAVKMLKDSHGSRLDLRRRFLTEARVGSRLQHPAIVPVYELGEFDDSRPYFTMRLVEGRTLVELIRARPDPSQDRPRLLTIFAQVCQAVAYAHSKGVIHRDLKPHNIMVGEFGEVQVVDWGFALLLGGADSVIDRDMPPAGADGQVSLEGGLMGTPAYMPPEQARGDSACVDARADVFSLGAILSEILTGRPPYVGESEEEVLGKAARGELSGALARLDTCGADRELLDLTRSCLSADPNGRPADAAELANRVTNYLASVEQKLHEAREDRAAAEARSQQVLATATAERRARRLTLGLAACLLILSVTGAGTWWWLSRQSADRQARAGQALTEAVNLRDRQKWPEALASARNARDMLGDAEGSVPIVRRVLEELEDLETARELEEGRLQKTAEPEVGRRFLVERAVPRYERAFAARGIRVGESDPTDVAAFIRGRPASIHGVMVAALDDWLQIARDGGRSEKDWLAAVVREADADAWRRQVREAITLQDRASLERLAAEPDLSRQPPATVELLARALGVAGSNGTAVTLLRRAQHLYPDDFWVNNSLGFYLLRLKPPLADEASRCYSAAVALRPSVATAHANLAYALSIKGDWTGVIESSRRAAELNPNSQQVQNNLGTGLHRKGNLAAARVAFEAALHSDPDFAEAHNNLGLLLLDMAEVDRAVEHFRRAVRLAPGLSPAHNNLGLALQRKGDREGALKAFTKALEVSPDHVQARCNRGAALLALRRPGEAIEDLQEAVKLKPDFGEAQLYLGAALFQQGDRPGASIAYDKSFRAGLGKAPRYVELGSALRTLGENDRAATAFQEAIRRDPNHGPSYFGLAGACLQMEKWVEAASAFREAARLGFNPAEAHRHAGRCLRELGKFRESVDAYRSALRRATANSLVRQVERELSEVERLIELDGMLPAVRCGLIRPSNADEMAELARFCSRKRMFATAVHFYRQAFNCRSDLTNILGQSHRLYAARAAVLAGTGEGSDLDGTDSASRAQLRALALDWLRADLVLWEEGRSPSAGAQMQLWLRDKGLAGIREPDRLAGLPDAEVKGCLQFWADVRALQIRHRATKAPAGRTNSIVSKAK